MLELTFAEQVKIVLNRKGMTIKELAERIEEQTGKKMSRQNLTQRLTRDNFQEQDMRMIAGILGCPLYLSILEDDSLGRVTPQKHVEERREEPAQKDEQALPPVPGNERDITVGELLEIHRELDAIEEEKVVETDVSNLAELEPVEEQWQASVQETAEAEESADNYAEEELPAEMEEPEVQEKPEEKPPEKMRGWRSYLHRRKKRAEDFPVVPAVEMNTGAGGYEEPEEYEDVQEEVEDTAAGEVNPYTGREYQTNSVRMHPERIGYVQVYDRGEHRWTDMTEWAFLGYQERKKALLGKDYEPPIYLD